MKLIRLATDNHGIFSNTFGNEMILQPFSKVALLNLTFGTNIGNFVVIEQGSQIIFKSDNDDDSTQQTIVIPQRDYLVAEADTFYTDIQHALNGAMSQFNSIEDNSGLIYSTGAYSSTAMAFKIGTTDDGFKNIQVRYAPFINPITSFSSVLFQTMIWSDTITSITFGSGAGQYRTTIIAKEATQVATEDRTNKILPLTGRRLNDGTSLFMARVRDLTDNGSGLQDNGFGIGLSKTDLGQGTFDAAADIPANQRDFEIRVNRPAETYKFIQREVGTDEQDGGILPTRVSITAFPLVDEHDIMFMRVSNNKLIMGVINETNPGGAATQTLFGSPIDINAGEELYPYIYLRGAAANCSVDAFNFTIDPWLPGIGGDENGNENWALTGKDDTALFNGYEDAMNYASGLGFPGKYLPQIGYNAHPVSLVVDRFNDIRDIPFTLQINRDVLKALGFSQYGSGETNATISGSIGQNKNPQYWTYINAASLPAANTSDNFIVESMSLPLDSFDASKSDYSIPDPGVIVSPTADKAGRRKNILMTIPENDNTDGLVEYESSTPIFIDMNNDQPINVKNLNFRILRKDFTPITQTVETAIMTILIDSMDKRNM